MWFGGLSNSRNASDFLHKFPTLHQRRARQLAACARASASVPVLKLRGVMLMEMSMLVDVTHEHDRVSGVDRGRLTLREQAFIESDALHGVQAVTACGVRRVSARAFVVVEVVVVVVIVMVELLLCHDAMSFSGWR